MPRPRSTRHAMLAAGLVGALLLGGCSSGSTTHTKASATATSTPTQQSHDTGAPVEEGGTVAEGQAFSVEGLDYAAGWSVGKDGTGAGEIRKLEVTDHDGDLGQVLLEFTFASGGTKVGEIDCLATSVKQEVSEALECLGTRKLASYDTITIKKQSSL